MSLIHEALEKVEKGKKGKEEAGEGKEKEEGEAVSRAGAPPSRLVYGIGGALVLLLTLGVVYLLAVPPRTEEGVRKSPPFPPSPVKTNFFSLTGITREGTDWTAIINNQLVRVGDGVSGATVESIQQERVVLNFKGETITLSLHG